MADETVELSVLERVKLKEELRAKYGTKKAYLSAIATARLTDPKAKVTEALIENVDTQVRRILNIKDTNERNGLLSREWKMTLEAVLKDSVVLSSINRTVEEIFESHAGREWPPHISQGFVNYVKALHVSSELQSHAVALLTHPDFPLWMSVGGVMLQNPIWKEIPRKRREELRKIYDPCGPTPPRIMHLDLILIRRDDHFGHGELYTYPSPDWKTNLIHFRPWLPEDNPKEGISLLREKLSKHWEIAPKSILVDIIPHKFLVSLKPHFKHGDLYLYVMNFCSVRFQDVSEKLKQRLRLDSTHTNTDVWRNLKTLRQDVASWRANGDVIRAIHELFEVNLDRLPTSFPEAVTT